MGRNGDCVNCGRGTTNWRPYDTRYNMHLCSSCFRFRERYGRLPTQETAVRAYTRPLEKKNKFYSMENAEDVYSSGRGYWDNIIRALENKEVI